MPRLKSADSLTDVCLKNIARNMDSYWLTDLDIDIAENPYLRYIDGPFEHLMGYLIQELIYTLSSLKNPKRRHLQALISGKLRSLDFSKSIEAANNDLILISIANRCEMLTSLNINGCDNIAANFIGECIRNLRLLKNLHLSRTKTNDSVLAVISEYCTFLLSLDISYCRTITNTGAENLCRTDFKDGPKCLKLQKLIIIATNIFDKGAVLIIQTFKDLQFFDYSESFGAVLTVLEKRRNIDTDTIFKFTKLSCSQQTFDADDFKFMVKSCPFITEFETHNRVKSENLLYLKDLCSLTVCYSYIQLLPFLKVKGDNLTSLSLEYVEDLNIEMLGKYCPNLIELYMSMSLYPASSDKTADIFKRLEILTIHPQDPSGYFPEVDLATILKNATNLKKMTLLNIGVDENLLKRILNVNPLMKLEELCVDDCQNVEIFWELIIRENSLKKIVFIDCFSMMTDDIFENFRKYIQQNCLDLTLSFNDDRYFR